MCRYEEKARLCDGVQVIVHIVIQTVEGHGQKQNEMSAGTKLQPTRR